MNLNTKVIENLISFFQSLETEVDDFLLIRPKTHLKRREALAWACDHRFSKALKIEGIKKDLIKEVGYKEDELIDRIINCYLEGTEK